MRALCWMGDSVGLGVANQPSGIPGFLQVRVVVAGICRTDLLAASGGIPVPAGRVLGHELAGVSERGQRVAVFPGLPCGSCLPCREGLPPWRCVRPAMLGIDVDGAFAEWLRVPESCVFPVPGGVSWRQAAFAEPVAAALGVVEADRRLDARILVHGSGRIAELAERVLRFSGRSRVVRVGEGESVAAQSVDLAVETTGKSEDIGVLLNALVPGGTLVLKSRLPGRLELDPSLIVRKSLHIVGVHYGDFQGAIALLARGLPVGDLLGEAVPLDSWAQAFEAARGEKIKQFLQISPDPGV